MDASPPRTSRRFGVASRRGPSARWSPSPRTTGRRWTFRTTTGSRTRAAGGALLDLGVYPISFTIDLLGAPQEVSAVGRLTETGVDGHVALVLGYGPKTLAQLDTTLWTKTPTTAVISGTEGSIEIDGDFYGPNLTRLRQGRPRPDRRRVGWPHSQRFPVPGGRGLPLCRRREAGERADVVGLVAGRHGGHGRGAPAGRGQVSGSDPPDGERSARSRRPVPPRRRASSW